MRTKNITAITIVALTCIYALTSCGGGRQTILVEEAQAVNQIREAAITATIAAGTLSAAIDTAISAHQVAINERNNALFSGSSTSASRAESVAATSVRAVGVTIDETAARADALVGAGADAPRRVDLVFPLSVVSEFSNSIAEKHDQLNQRIRTFSQSAQNVHVRSGEVTSAVDQADSATDALAAADSITVARNSLDDALAVAVNADVQLSEILNVLKFDAERLEDAARSIEFSLPAGGAPRRDLE